MAFATAKRIIPALAAFWVQGMQGYRAYILGPDGHVQKRIDLHCQDEPEAIKQAKQLVDGHDVELGSWIAKSRLSDIPSKPVTADRAR